MSTVMPDEHFSFATAFTNEAVDLERLRERAFGLRWAALPADVIPLTAAEPDFAVAMPIRQAVKRYLDAGLLPYGPPEGLPELRQAAANMLRHRRALYAAPEEIFVTDGVASGMQLVARLSRMRDLVVDRLNRMARITCRCPEGTYVVFPKVGSHGISSEALSTYLLNQARVAVVPGTARWFGPGAEGHIRICFATSEQILTTALDRIERAMYAL